MNELQLRAKTRRRMSRLVQEFVSAGPEPRGRRLLLMASLGHLKGLNLGRFDYEFTTAKSRFKMSRNDSRDARLRAHVGREEMAAQAVDITAWNGCNCYAPELKAAVLSDAAILMKGIKFRDKLARVIQPLMAKYGVSETTLYHWLRKAGLKAG